MATAWITGADNVMSWVGEMSRTPYYSLWNGRQLLYSWPFDEETKNLSQLQFNLKMMEDQGVSDVLTLRLHNSPDKGGYLSDKSDYYASLNFRPSAQFQPGAVSGLQFPRNEGMQAIADRLIALEEKIDEPDSKPESSVMGQINDLLSNPNLQPLVQGLLSGLMKGMGLPVPDHAPGAAVHHPAAVSGIAEDQDSKIDRALDELSEVSDTIGDDLLLVSDIAKRDPSGFRNMLNMLRQGNG